MPSKRYMVRCDIEGVSGVVSYEQAEPGKREYAFGHEMFMSDLIALLQGLNAGGADEVVIYDEHYYGRNIDMGELVCNVSAICGKPPYRPDWAGGLDASFAGVVLLGFHSKFGTPGGLLHHTYELDIRDLRINGVSVGEIGMEAAIAGDYGVPVVLVTGDSAGVAEAPIAMPRSAAASAGASLIPSPTMATWRPSERAVRTSCSFSSGNSSACAWSAPIAAHTSSATSLRSPVTMATRRMSSRRRRSTTPRASGRSRSRNVPTPTNRPSHAT